jgi:hypothetical protein
MTKASFTRADSVYVDTDEGRYQLHIHTDEGEYLIVDIHADAIKFYENVRREIGPWAHEAESARQAVKRGVTLDEYVGRVHDDGEGYDLDDPKHPTFYERMVD